MSSGNRTIESMFSVACLATLVGAISAAPASAQSADGTQPAPPIHCDALPQIKPLFGSRSDTFENNFDCLAWQDLIYLMWPAKASERGAPDANGKLGASGPTVWETYRTVDTVFLPNGRDPGPWQQPQLIATLEGPLAQQVASGAVRHLTMTSKVSPEVLANLRSKTAIPPPILDEIHQAGGGTLYDLNGKPVYYEVAIDKPEYDYIRRNKLYNAGEQTKFARTNVISLPAGTADRTQNPTGAVEVKAAWKVLSQAESQSGRFRTMRALIGPAIEPVTVGLVGFHIFIVDGMQGGWATFSQMDNAPTQGGRIEPSATFGFFNPKCTVPGTSDPCPVNVENANPGQVMQITPNAAVADRLNGYMHSILRQCQAQQKCDPNPWQYYNLIDVQWPKHPVIISKIKPPASPPLPEGTPNVPLPGNDMLNPVTETFLQLPPRKQIPIVATGASCLGCHQFASTAGAGTYATSYSFIFDRAKQ